MLFLSILMITMINFDVGSSVERCYNPRNLRLYRYYACVDAIYGISEDKRSKKGFYEGK